MKRRRIKFPTLPDPIKVARVEELLRVCAAFRADRRAVPGHIRRELVRLAAHWKGQAIPPEVIAAQRVLQEPKR